MYRQLADRAHAIGIYCGAELVEIVPPARGCGRASLCKRISHTAGRHPVHDQFLHMRGTTSLMNPMLASEPTIPFQNLEFVFPMIFRDQEPLGRMSICLAADGAGISSFVDHGVTFQANRPIAALRGLCSRITVFNRLMGMFGKRPSSTCKGMVETPLPCSNVRVRVEEQLSHNQ